MRTMPRSDSELLTFVKCGTDTCEPDGAVERMGGELPNISWSRIETGSDTKMSSSAETVGPKRQYDRSDRLGSRSADNFRKDHTSVPNPRP